MKPYNRVIAFTNAQLYRTGSDPILKGVSLDIEPGSKVGICGRTGRSVASLCLFLVKYD